MVRATAAEMVKKFSDGQYPGSWDATSFGDIATQTDAEINGRAKPNTFGTGTEENEFANELAVRKVRMAIWSSGKMTTNPPVVWDKSLEMWFESLLTSTTKRKIHYVKMQDSS